MKASIGRVVIVKGQLVSSNGTDEQAAMITRVWSPGQDTADGPFAVNLTVFPDCGAPKNFSSVMLYDSRTAAQHNFGQPGLLAFWPDRV